MPGLTLARIEGRRHSGAREKILPARIQPLFRRLAVEAFVVRLGVSPGVVDDAVPVIRR